MSSIDQDRLRCTVATLREKLLALRQPAGHWVGHLSSSALSTATAAFALAQVDRIEYRCPIDHGLCWLCANQNADGGWGDTVQSPSNLSTTLLCYSALAIPEPPAVCLESIAKTESWLRRTVGTLEPQALAQAVDQQYGKDRTFSVPILTLCALAGRLGSGPDAWRSIRPLPFELAVLPHRLFKWLRLPVVSYALPALIAMGQARYAHRKPRNPLARLIRSLARRRSLDVLATLQPDNGGFLEAAPLTSFVTMSLASCGYGNHQVVRKGVEFLVASMRDDGSWPIDTDLATWVTTLSIYALAAGGDDNLPGSEKQRLRDWLLACQHTRIHPYTQAPPGGWAWSNLPGAVPDADDTAGALLALHQLDADSEKVSEAAASGIDWLLGLQNSDEGIPTFCRGWTKLPFDKSAPDITAHMVGAVGAWLDALHEPAKQHAEQGMLRALAFLQESQNDDGSWRPLWFGNQFAADKANPVYGTSRVLTHLSRVPDRYRDQMGLICEKALRWLLAAQNGDGGWGGAPGIVSSIEETALAVDALAEALLSDLATERETALAAVYRGAGWLMANTDRGRSVPAAPIGLYFAQLWYFEDLYPLVFALSALAKVRRVSAAR
jgi:squalene-hopene/tetraprenyl-beta-curcumene cyclase